MARWWEMSAVEIARNPEAQRERQRAYHETFLQGEPGRQVLADLQRLRWRLWAGPSATVPEQAIALVATADLINRIVRLCGPCDPLKLIENREALTDPEELAGAKQKTEGDSPYDID